MAYRSSEPSIAIITILFTFRPLTPLRHVVAAGACAAAFSLCFKSEPFSLAAPLPKNASIFGDSFFCHLSLNRARLSIVRFAPPSLNRLPLWGSSCVAGERGTYFTERCEVAFAYCSLSVTSSQRTLLWLLFRLDYSQPLSVSSAATSPSNEVNPKVWTKIKLIGLVVSSVLYRTHSF